MVKMDNKDLLEEIRLNRKEIQSLKQEFFIFKGKAYGFIAVISIVVNAAIAWFTKK